MAVSSAPPRLLIVNCASPYFFSIPMGSFGLCDALGKQGMEARIFNPALYPETEARQRLDATLHSLRPSHVGFVCHWQETVNGLVAAVAMVREWSREVVTLCGGFTAAYFAETLLETVEGLDYVVIGDPEEPVAHLLQGRPPASIANLVWREGGAIRRSDVRWLMEQPLFDSLRFADSSFLVDAPRYFAKTEAKLGFPVLLGRGCVFDCEYCGGSRHAFRLHSGRSKPVTRSIAAILADLRLLKAATTVLYICYENDPGFVKSLFRAIGDDRELRGHFTLHYGAWHLLDDEFLDLYRRAFDCVTLPPIFEFSPEVMADDRRRGIKRGETYRLEAMEANFRAIDAAFAGRVRIEVFCSRYHPAISAAELREELGAIVRLKHRMLRQGLPVHVCFDHLSTDVGSRYWEEHQDRPRDFARFLDLKAQVDEGRLYPFPVDNLCLHMPEHLPMPLLVRHEALLLVVEQLERQCHELLHILVAWYRDRWLDELQAVLEPLLFPLATFFAAPPLAALLAGLEQRLQSTGSAGEPPPFLADLLRFSQKKIEQIQRPAPVCADSAAPQADTRYVLDRARITIHEQDYLDLLPLLARLEAHPAGPLPYRRTVCLFLHSGIVAMPHAFYRAILHLFEQPRTLHAYRAELCRTQGIDMEHHLALLDRLLAEGVLLAAPPDPAN